MCAFEKVRTEEAGGRRECVHSEMASQNDPRNESCPKAAMNTVIV
jgi:hypothetical protein